MLMMPKLLAGSADIAFCSESCRHLDDFKKASPHADASDTPLFCFRFSCFSLSSKTVRHSSMAAKGAIAAWASCTSLSSVPGQMLQKKHPLRSRAPYPPILLAWNH